MKTVATITKLFILLFSINIAAQTSTNKEDLKQVVDLIKKENTKLNFKDDKKLDKSLNVLINSIGDKKVIAIGEDTHGTSEYFKLREAITKKLILEKGFNTVVLENPYDDIELLTQNIQKAPINDLMRKHLFSIYQTEEMKSFVTWLKDNPSVKVKFKGCDDSYWVLPQLLDQEIKTINDSKLTALLNTFKDQVNLDYAVYNAKYLETKEDIKNNNHLSSIAYKTATIIEDYLIKKNLYSNRLKELLFNAKNSYINYSNITTGKSIITRDEIMANRIKYFAKNIESKVIVWAHNAHISNKVIFGNEIGVMGRDLKKEFGENYHPIGMSSLNGSYSYISNRIINNDHNYDDKLLKGILENQPEISWESNFSQIKEAAYYVSLQKVKKELKVKNIEEKLKVLGYGKESQEDYYKLSPLTMFDTLIFIKTTKATTPLFG